MTTLEDMRRLAALAGERALVAAIDRATKPKMPADLLVECERAAGLATCNLETEQRK